VSPSTFFKDEKLKIIRNFESIGKITWDVLTPNDSGDWINQRNPDFQNFIPIGGKNESSALKIFNENFLGAVTSRDSWVFNFSKQHLSDNMRLMIKSYNENVKIYESNIANEDNKTNGYEKYLNTDPTKISWSTNLIKSFKSLKHLILIVI
jgi:predicted helicase